MRAPLLALLLLGSATAALAGCPAPITPGGDSGDARVDAPDGAALPPLAVTEDEHIAGCARLAACFPEGAQPLSVCASSYPYFLADFQLAELSAVVRCANAAGTDCERVRACTNAGAAPTPCDPATDEGRCDGSIARSCRARTGLTYAVDCAAIGRVCSVDNGGRPTCGLGSCTVGTPDRCDENLLVQCIDGVLGYSDCGRVGLRCISVGPVPGQDAAAGSSVARCAGRGSLCNPDFIGSSCDGATVLRGCLGGYIAMVDCASVLPVYQCIQPDGGAPRCARTASPVCSADPINGSDFPERCDGTSIVYCRDGVSASLDCTSLGFARCEAAAGSSPHCAN